MTIASISTTQDTINALSRIMAVDDEESIIQLSRFLYRVFDVRNRAVLSQLMKFNLCPTEIKVMQVNDG